MRKIKTPRDAKGLSALKIRPITPRDAIAKQITPTSARNIKRGHFVKGMRDFNRIGWEDWEKTVSETWKAVEKQRFGKANQFYSALKRANELLGEIRSREEKLKVQSEELKAANEEMQTTNEEMQSANEELRATTEELERTSAHQKILMDSMMDTVLTTDKKGVIKDVNLAAERTSGYTHEELIGKPFRRFFTQPERAQAGIKKALAKKEVSNYNLTMVTKDGRKVPMSYNAVILRDQKGKVTGVLGNAHDITELKKAEAAREKAAAANEAVLKGITVVADELVKGNLDVDVKALIPHANIAAQMNKIIFGLKLVKSEVIEEKTAPKKGSTSGGRKKPKKRKS